MGQPGRAASYQQAAAAQQQLAAGWGCSCTVLATTVVLCRPRAQLLPAAVGHSWRAALAAAAWLLGVDAHEAVAALGRASMVPFCQGRVGRLAPGLQHPQVDWVGGWGRLQGGAAMTLSNWMPDQAVEQCAGRPRSPEPSAWRAPQQDWGDVFLSQRSRFSLHALLADLPARWQLGRPSRSPSSCEEVAHPRGAPHGPAQTRPAATPKQRAMAQASACITLQLAAFAAGGSRWRLRRAAAARRLDVAAQASSSNSSVSGVPDKDKPDWAGGCRARGAGRQGGC